MFTKSPTKSSTKSSASYTMKAMLAGAALAGLVASTTGAQASVARVSTSVSTEAAADVGDVVTTTAGSKYRYHRHCHHRHHRHCHHRHVRVIIFIG